MNIQDFSERTGISKSALRYYEQKNLLLPRKRGENGYRIYSGDQIETVKLISSLRLVGISIKEIQIYLLEKEDEIRQQMINSWITDIKKKRNLLTIGLHYLESNSINKEIYLIDKEAEQIIWYVAVSKVGEFKEHFFKRGSELRQLNIPFKNCYLKYLSGSNPVKVQIGFGVAININIPHLQETLQIEYMPPCRCIAMPFKGPISTIQNGYTKLISYAYEHRWSPLSSILERYYGMDFTELQLLMPVTQLERGEEWQ